MKSKIHKFQWNLKSSCNFPLSSFIAFSGAPIRDWLANWAWPREQFFAVNQPRILNLFLLPGRPSIGNRYPTGEALFFWAFADLIFCLPIWSTWQLPTEAATVQLASADQMNIFLAHGHPSNSFHHFMFFVLFPCKIIILMNSSKFFSIWKELFVCNPFNQSVGDSHHLIGFSWHAPICQWPYK